jgi:hypothetical protein
MTNTRSFAQIKSKEINHFLSPGKPQPSNVFKPAPGHAPTGMTTREKHLDKLLISR